MSDFFFTGTEYVYLGDSMETLAVAIEENLAEKLLEDRIVEKEQRVASGNTFEERLSTFEAG